MLKKFALGFFATLSLGWSIGTLAPFENKAEALCWHCAAADQCGHGGSAGRCSVDCWGGSCVCVEEGSCP
jgi:hypothetical protein